MILAIAAGALLLAAPASPGQPGPCPEGRYLVEQMPGVTDGLEVVSVGASSVDIEPALCAAPRRVEIRRAPRSKTYQKTAWRASESRNERSAGYATRVKATWESCSEWPGQVKLRAQVFAPDCVVMTGHLVTPSEAPRVRRFVARLSVCGDGILDPGAGEQCEPTGSANCDANCQRVPLTGGFLALTYNVAGLPEGISGSNPSVNMPLIGPLLNGYDLVLVQESWQTPDPNPLAPLRVYHEILDAAAEHPYRSVPAPLPLGNDPRRPSAVVSDGLNRFSRLFFEPVVRQVWAECFESSADCLSLKGFSVARTTLADGMYVDVYNLHMEAGGDPEDDRLREQAVNQMADFMAEFSAGQPLIVGGDFNLHSDDEPDASVFELLLARTGLQDACAALGCPESGRIDKFLFRSSDHLTIMPTSWSAELDVFVRDDGEPLSDHDAIAVRFEWAGFPAED